MEGGNIFQSSKEIERLKVQSRLLDAVEKPLLSSLFSSSEDLCVLDIGCNDGEKTVSLFDGDNIRSVIGIEYSAALSSAAEKRWGNGKFHFDSLDASSEDFPFSLRRIMKSRNVEAFDCIYLSFVLMHISSPETLLSTLKDFLKSDGVIVIVEADDSTSFLFPDDGDMLGTFLSILSHDRYAGDRSLGSRLESLVYSSGYGSIDSVCSSISAGRGEMKKKEMIYTVFFSYLEDDIDIIMAEDESDCYREWKTWLLDNLPSLKALILNSESEISMGMKILALRKGGE